MNFGPIGGAITGAFAALAYSTKAEEQSSHISTSARVTSGAAAGLAAGLTYVHINSAIAPFGLLGHTVLIVLPAIACLAIMTAAGLIEKRHYVYRTLLERLRMGSLLSTEFAIGIALAAGLRVLYALSASEPMLILMPIVYLAKQSLDGSRTSEEPSSPEHQDEKLADLYLSTVYSLIAAIDARDRFTRTHTTNVAKLALSIARKLNLSVAEMEGLKMAALFHDIGKLWVPEHILLKPGRLSPDQFAKIQHHPALGQKILGKVDFPWPVGTMVRGHHERWDGTGYPDRLRGEQIPLGARILCLADVFDAMTSKRSYRASNSVQDTVKYIRSAAGSHFDPAVARAFEHVIADGDLPGVDRKTIIDAAHKAAVKSAQPQDKAPTVAEDSSRTSSEFIAMFEIAQTASTSVKLEKMLYLLAGKIKSMISCSSCVIFLRDGNSDQLEIKTALGADSKYFEGGRTTIGQGQTGMVAETGQGMIVEFDRRDVMLPYFLEPWAKLDEWVELRSVIIMPIAGSDGVLGTINLYRANENGFSDEDFRLLAAVAPQVSKAIQNALLFKHTTESAQTDVLTELHNARYLFSNLEQELNRAKRLNKSVSVLGMDLDNFKDINDTFGHQQGDLVLRELAQLFLGQVRDNDRVCRYAGDEFAIVLPDTDKAEALETARRIQSVVDGLKPYKSKDKQIHVGVSIGVATSPEDGDDVRTLIARADVNMYADKKRRRESASAA